MAPTKQGMGKDLVLSPIESDLKLLSSSLVPAQDHKNSKSNMIHAVLMEKTMVAGYEDRIHESEAHWDSIKVDYQNIEQGGTKNHPVPSHAWICHKTTQEWEQVCRPKPGVDVDGRLRRLLPERPSQVGDQVGTYPVVWDPLHHLHTFHTN